MLKRAASVNEWVHALFFGGGGAYLGYYLGLQDFIYSWVLDQMVFLFPFIYL